MAAGPIRKFGRRGQQKGLLTAPADLTIWRQLVPPRIRLNEPVNALNKAWRRCPSDRARPSTVHTRKHRTCFVERLEMGKNLLIGKRFSIASHDAEQLRIGAEVIQCP
jgi:hypothetical protein